MPRTLVVLHVSPWSERARWALDHHRLAYDTAQHVPMFGEPLLRWRVGRRTPEHTRVTVPVLLDGGAVFADSWDIVRHADQVGSGPPLVPEAHAEAIRAWVDRIDAAAGRLRAAVTVGMLASPGALDEALPPGTPAWIGPLVRPVTRFATRWFARKYDLALDALEAHEQAVREVLDALRVGLGPDGSLLGAFTFADIAAATLLQGIRPVDDAWIRLGPATRAVWTRPALAEAYPDLLAWRDRLYAERRARQ